MAEGARVQSVDSIRAFRNVLMKFCEVCNLALGDAEADLTRTYTWLEGEQTTYWTGMIRKRQEEVARAQDALRQKTLFKAPDGSMASTVDEKKNVQIALRRLEEAKAKLAAVKKWIGRFQKEVLLYKGQVQRLSSLASNELPAAAVHLTTMVQSLEEYIGLAGPEGLVPSMGGADRGAGVDAAGGGMARPEGAPSEEAKSPFAALRAHTPPGGLRQAAPMADAHVLVWQQPTLSEAHRDELLAVNSDPTPPGQGDWLAAAGDISSAAEIYFERISNSDATDSGWYVGSTAVLEENSGEENPSDEPSGKAQPGEAQPGEAQPGEAQRGEAKPVRLPLSNLLAARPDFREIFALPRGTLVVVGQQGVKAILNATDHDLMAPAPEAQPEPPSEGETTKPAEGEAAAADPGVPEESEATANSSNQ